MAWTNNAYCTLADVKLAIDPQMSTTDDTFLNNLIIQAQADVDREVGYPFQTDGTVGTPTTRTFDGTGMDRLKIDDMLSLSTATEVFHNTSLGATGIWVSGTTYTQDITADIVLKPNNYFPKYYLMRFSGLGFEEGLQNFSFSGVWGYPTDSSQIYPGIPSDITRATTRLVIHYYKMRDTNYADLTQEQGGIRERYTKTMPLDVVEVLNRYKRSVFLNDWT